MVGDMIVVVVDREMGFRRQLEKCNMPLAPALEARDLCFVVFFFVVVMVVVVVSFNLTPQSKVGTWISKHKAKKKQEKRKTKKRKINKCTPPKVKHPFFLSS